MPYMYDHKHKIQILKNVKNFKQTFIANLVQTSKYDKHYINVSKIYFINIKTYFLTNIKNIKDICPKHQN